MQVKKVTVSGVFHGAPEQGAGPDRTLFLLLREQKKDKVIPDLVPGGACRRPFTLIWCSYTRVDLIYVKCSVII